MPMDTPPDLNKEKTEVAKDTLINATQEEVTKPLNEVMGGLSSHLEELKAKHESRKNSLEKAKENLDTLKAKFAVEIDALHKRYPKKSGMIKTVGELPERIHTFTKSKLEGNSSKFEDPAFVNTGKDKLGDAVLDAGNPMTGDMVIALANILNQEVSNISGQTNTSEDMIKRSEVSDLVRFISAAEWDVAYSTYLLGKSAQEVKDFSSVVKTSNTEKSSDIAKSK